MKSCDLYGVSGVYIFVINVYSGMGNIIRRKYFEILIILSVVRPYAGNFYTVLSYVRRGSGQVIAVFVLIGHCIVLAFRKLPGA